MGLDDILGMSVSIILIIIILMRYYIIYKYHKLYIQAEISKGIVKEVIAKRLERGNGLYLYTKTVVEFYAHNQVCTDTLLLRGHKVKVGYPVDIHYIETEDRKIRVLNDIPTRIIKETKLALCISGLILLLIVLGAFIINFLESLYI